MRPRVVLACIAAACGIAAVATPAAGAVPGCDHPGPVTGAGGVNLYLSDGSIKWCSPATLRANADVPAGTSFPLQTGSGSQTPQTVNAGISIRSLLAAAGLTPEQVTAIQVSANGGRWSVLHPAGLRPTSNFDMHPVPIIDLTGTPLEFLRPPRGPNDNNQADAYSPQPGSPVDMFVDVTGPRLIVACSIPGTGSVVQPGKAVTFQASVQNPDAAGGSLTYRWEFGDGDFQQGGSTIKHTFKQAGSNPLVYVWVTGPNGSGGVCDQQQVQVRNSQSPPPTKSGGGSNGGSGSSGGSNNAGSSSNNYPNYNYTYTNPTTSTTPHKHSRPHSATNTPTLPGGKIVEGRLISAVYPVAPSQIAKGNYPPNPPANARVPQPSVFESASVRPIAALFAALAVVLLLSSGAGQELRSLRRSIASARLG